MSNPHTVFKLKGVSLQNWPLMHRALKDAVISSTTVGVAELFTVNDGAYVKVDPFGDRFNLTSSGSSVAETGRLETLALASTTTIDSEVEINPESASFQILSNLSAETTVILAWLLCLHEMNPDFVEVQTKATATQWQQALKIARDCGCSGDTVPWGKRPILLNPESVRVPASLDFRA